MSVVSLSLYSWLGLMGIIPMCQARHYLIFDVLLYIVPFLAILRWTRGQHLGEIAGLDIGEDTTLFDCVIVVDDCH